MVRKILLNSAALMMLIALWGTPSFAEQTGDHEWEWTIVPSAWFNHIRSQLIIGHEIINEEVGVDPTVHTTEVPLVLQLEGRYGRFGFFVQPIYLKLETSQSINGVDVDIVAQGWMVDLGGFYRWGAWGSGSERPAFFDLLIGGRYWSASTDVHSNVPVPNVTLESTQQDNFVDPFVGLRVGVHLSKRITFRIRGDIGGFGLSSGGFRSKLSWQAIGFFGYDFNKVVSLEVGYRALSFNIEDEHLAVNNRIKLLFSGPIAGLSFRF